MKVLFNKHYLGHRDIRALVTLLGYRRAIKVLNREYKHRSLWFSHTFLKKEKNTVGFFGWEESFYGTPFWLKVSRLGEHNVISEQERTAFKREFGALLFR